MTTLALAHEQWSFKGVDLSSYAYLVSSAAGADDFPPLRGEDETVPGLRGDRARGKVFGGRRFPLALFLSPMNAAGALIEPTNRRQSRVNLDALMAVLGQRSVGNLVRTMPDGTTRTAVAEVVAVDPVENIAVGEAYTLVVDFKLADPWFYGAAVAPVQAIAASPTNFALTNAGSVDAEKMVLDFLGPITNPRLINLTIDPGATFYVEALVTVAAGQHLLIDIGKWTALNNGTEAIGSIRHSGAFVFFRLVPGVNNLRVTATAPGGSLTVSYQPPYF